MIWQIKAIIYVVLCIVLSIILFTIQNNKIKLKHSIPWVILTFLSFILIIFWEKYSTLVQSLGIFSTADFTLFILSMIELVLIFYLWTRTSIETDNNKFSIQQDALLEKRIRELESKINDEHNSKSK